MIEKARADFELELETLTSLESALPFHSVDMPYHQRVLAFALSKSLHASMNLSGIAELTYQEAKKQLGT